jgi:hypothetical protein
MIFVNFTYSAKAQSFILPIFSMSFCVFREGAQHNFIYIKNLLQLLVVLKGTLLQKWSVGKPMALKINQDQIPILL